MKAIALALLLAPALYAQELSEADRSALRSMAEFAERELVRGAAEGAEATRLNAEENRKHVMRMVAETRANGTALKALGINAEVAAVGMLFSDLGKNAEYLDAHARKVFAELYRENPGLAKFKAFLLHEEPGIEKARELARRHGLSEPALNRVVDAIVGHNGPASEGSWWKTNWDKLIRDHQGPARSPLIGKVYPETRSAEGALHAVFDRVDQGALTRSGNEWQGGPRKIHNDIRGNMGFQEAILEALEGNPAKTLPQLEALRARHPQLFELDVVKSGVARLEATRNLVNHIEFLTEADGKVTKARIHSRGPDGQPRAVEVASYEAFWQELNKVDRPITGTRAWTPEGRALMLAGPPSPAFNAAERSRISSEINALRSEAAGRLTEAEARKLGEVIEFARFAHAGMRRDGGEPAISHSLRVAREVARSGQGSATAVYAAVLHDVVEDTKIGLEPIRQRFGHEVAKTVEALTIGPIAPGSDKATRDKAYYERFAKANRDAHVVKFHDRLDNIRDMRGWPTEGKLGYLESTRRNIAGSLAERSPDLARAMTAEVETIERGIRNAAEPPPEALARYRRGDGTLDWKRVTADKALQQGAGVAHFALALFLKEMAVVVKTGDRARIDEFFEGLASTDFFITYGLFSAGAQIGNVAYARFLEKHIKPRFVSGVLRTNIVLATGMALPEIVHGRFDGRAFAINVGSLGLSSVAVKAGLQSIAWVADLNRANQAGRLVNAAAGLRRFAKLGGWFYTAAETAVVLYLGDEISAAVNGFLDDRAARAAVGEGTESLLNAVANPALGAAAFEEALGQFEELHGDYRNHLYKSLQGDDEIYYARLNEAARKAKLAADKRVQSLARLDQLPALKAAVLRQYGSIEAYAAELEKKDEAELDALVARAQESYNINREAHLREVYEGRRRSSSYLDDANLAYAARGALPGAAGDPYRGRNDLFARWGRESLRNELRDAASEISLNRLQAYADQAAALRLAMSLTTDSVRRNALRGAMERVERLHEADAKLSGVSSRGAAGALSGSR